MRDNGKFQRHPSPEELTHPRRHSPHLPLAPGLRGGSGWVQGGRRRERGAHGGSGQGLAMRPSPGGRERGSPGGGQAGRHAWLDSPTGTAIARSLTRSLGLRPAWPLAACLQARRPPRLPCPLARPESLYVNEAQLAVCSAHRPGKEGGQARRGGGPLGIHITQQQSGRLI